MGQQPLFITRSRWHLSLSRVLGILYIDVPNVDLRISYCGARRRKVSATSHTAFHCECCVHLPRWRRKEAFRQGRIRHWEPVEDSQQTSSTEHSCIKTFHILFFFSSILLSLHIVILINNWSSTLWSEAFIIGWWFHQVCPHDCVNIHEQPVFDNPALMNHKFQVYLPYFIAW